MARPQIEQFLMPTLKFLDPFNAEIKHYICPYPSISQLIDGLTSEEKTNNATSLRTKNDKSIKLAWSSCQTSLLPSLAKVKQANFLVWQFDLATAFLEQMITQQEAYCKIATNKYALLISIVLIAGNLAGIGGYLQRQSN